MNKKLIVHTIVNGPLSENTYFVHYEDSKDGFLIDPGMDQKIIEEGLNSENFNVKFILLTHSHFDHMLTAEYFKNEFNAPIYVSEYEIDTLKSPTKNMSAFFHCSTSIEDVTPLKGENGVLDRDGYHIEYYLTPGHTFGGLCFYFKEDRIMFTGDTMFMGTYGRTDLYGGSNEKIKNSLKEIFTYPDDTIIYPGHGDSCTISENKKYLKEDLDKL